jgi:hypothetical protein
MTVDEPSEFGLRVTPTARGGAMTEEEWERCDSPGRALQAINRLIRSANSGLRRKFRLVGCHALRRIQRHATDERFGRALDVAERHFDGTATFAELRAAVVAAQQGYEAHRSDLEEPDERAAQKLTHLLRPDPFAAAYDSFGAVSFEWWRGADEVRAELMGLIREVFGNPFRPVAFDPAWRTGTAIELARQMYDAREFSAMPILADALQDAGCENADVLGHCRGPGPHVRGCWVVDLVLGNS